MESTTRIEVLGAPRFMVEGSVRRFPGGRQGALLQRLLLDPVETLAVRELAATLWPGDEPRLAIPRLRVTAARLRRVLPPGVGLETVAGGYRLDLHDAVLDRSELEDRANAIFVTGDRAAAQEALEHWRGEPYLGWPEGAELRRVRHQLEVLRARLQVIAGAAAATAGHASSAPRSSVPAPPGDAVERPRLLDPLPRAGAVRLLAFTAPAGYGKTVLLAQWALRERERAAWVQLSDAHNDAEVLAAAIHEAVRLAADIPPPARPSVDAAPPSALSIVNDLVTVDRPVAVVLDDLHHVSEPAALDVLGGLLRHAPPTLTLAVASRRALPVPTGRLHAHGQMVTLTAADLSFTPDEIAAFGCPPAWAGQLHAATDGWPAPTATIATAADTSAPPDAEEILAALDDGGLLGPMLGDLPADLVELLVDTAHLTNLHGDLVDCVTGGSGGAEALEALASDYLLIDSLAPAYRHRRLLATMLRRRRDRRGRGFAQERHRRAAAWYLANDEPDEALSHAAAAGDTGALVASLGAAVQRAARQGDAARLRQWTGTVPLPDEAGVKDSVQVALLAAALLPPHERDLWHHARCSSAPAAVVATIEAADRLRTGDCEGSLTSVHQARRSLRHLRGPTREIATALLAAVEADNHLLLERPRAPSMGRFPRHADVAPWPWFLMWAFGQRAFDAYVSGAPAFAGALLDHADGRCPGLHPSWWRAAGDWTTVTRALLEADRHPGAPDAGTVEKLDALARRTAGSPIAALARYVLHYVRARAGQRDAAAALADADTAANGALPFLRTVRTRLVGGTVGGPSVGSESLSPREATVLAYLATDLTLPEIAERLFLSAHTVRAHTKSIYRKLGVRSRSEAARSSRPTSG